MVWVWGCSSRLYVDRFMDRPWRQYNQFNRIQFDTLHQHQTHGIAKAIARANNRNSVFRTFLRIPPVLIVVSFQQPRFKFHKEIRHRDMKVHHYGQFIVLLTLIYKDQKCIFRNHTFAVLLLLIITHIVSWHMHCIAYIFFTKNSCSSVQSRQT